MFRLKTKTEASNPECESMSYSVRHTNLMRSIFQTLSIPEDELQKIEPHDVLFSGHEKIRINLERILKELQDESKRSNQMSWEAGRRGRLRDGQS